MNQIDNLIRQMRQLPYADMMELAKAVHERLEAQGASTLGVERTLIADVLSSIEVGSVPTSELTTEEQAVLRKVFNRKRTVTIAQLPTGFRMECSTLQGSGVLGTDLRVMWSNMLDQIVTLESLKEGLK